MKKIFTLIMTIVCVIALAGCGTKAAAGVSIDYGTSEIYTQDDMNAAIALITEEFNSWEGCELHSIAYSSDDENNADNVAWMNELGSANGAGEVFTQCIMFTSSFHSPEEGGGAWEADQEYTNWQWWLARSEGGEWQLMTWGY